MTFYAILELLGRIDIKPQEYSLSKFQRAYAELSKVKYRQNMSQQLRVQILGTQNKLESM